MKIERGYALGYVSGPILTDRSMAEGACKDGQRVRRHPLPRLGGGRV
jgi:hypothetical protein